MTLKFMIMQKYVTRKSMSRLSSWSCLLWLLALSSSSIAAEIYPSSFSLVGFHRSIVIEGDIEPGDFDTFIEIVKENQGEVTTVELYTQGGDYYEAIKIGRAVRSLELDTYAPYPDRKTGPSNILPKKNENLICASAGFFIYIGGVSRTGYIIGAHRPYFQKGKFGNLDQKSAQIEFDKLMQISKKYMNDMGVQNFIQDKILATPPHTMWMIDLDTINTYFFGEIPYRRDWIDNRCSSANYKEYNICAQKSIRDSRLEAYERFFEKKPNDTEDYDFSSWVDVAKYINMPVHKVISKGNYIRRYPEAIALEKEATATTPYVMLRPWKDNKNIIAHIIVKSWINPSPEFINNIINILEDYFKLGVISKHPHNDENFDFIFDNNSFKAISSDELYMWTGDNCSAYLSLEVDKNLPFINFLKLEVIAE